MATRVHATLEELVRLQFDARGFSLLPRQPVNSLLSGRHASRLRGRGLTFEELRDYRPGDDIRSIDWRATARLRKTHVRVYSEERERPVLLVVDQRSTMFFGTSRTTKATAATELAALGAWAALDSGDRVGAVIFGDDDIVEIKPHRSRENVLRICHDLVRLNTQLSASGRNARHEVFNDALLRAVNVAKHDHLVVLVTDYDGHDENTHRHATRLARHNDVLATLVYDPLGASIPVYGQAEVTDGNQQVSIDVSGESNDRFEEEFRRYSQQIRQRLRSIRVPVLPICTHEPVVDQLLSAFGSTSMMPDAASLENLRDIAEPVSVSWWPLAPGWWFLIAATIIALTVFAYRGWQRWKANAYRRAALAELKSATTDATVAQILKRTALCAYSREYVASLTGEDWCQWLGKTADTDVPQTVLERLSAGVFNDDSAWTSELADFATHWINHHTSQSEIRQGGQEQ